MMVCMKKIGILTCLMISCLLVNAQVVREKDSPVIEKIMQGNRTYTTIVSDFKQTQHLPIIEEDITTGGTFYYKKPEQLAMHYNDPAGDMMLLDGDKFIMVAAGKKREISAKSNPKMQGMKAILSACLQGNALQIGAEKITCEETANQYVVTAELSQGANESNFFKVVAGYDKKDLSLSVLKTIESDGSYTMYELSKKEFNKSIDDTHFKYSK